MLRVIFGGGRTRPLTSNRWLAGAWWRRHAHGGGDGQKNHCGQKDSTGGSGCAHVPGTSPTVHPAPTTSAIRHSRLLILRCRHTVSRSIRRLWSGGHRSADVLAVAGTDIADVPGCGDPELCTATSTSFWTSYRAFRSSRPPHARPLPTPDNMYLIICI